MHCQVRLAATVLAAGVLITSSAVAAPPATITFDGVLTNASGVPKANGAYSITFRLFDSLVGGTLLWTEANKSVTVAGGQGRFQTVLGEPTAFALPFNNPYFLEIQVIGEAASMTPRLPLRSAPYALNGGTANLSLPFTGSANVASPGAALTLNNTGTGLGIQSTAPAHIGVYGISNTWVGVWGQSTSSSGVHGVSDSWVGTSGVSNTGAGVYGESTHWAGVWGQSVNSSGVTALSEKSYGLFAKSTDWEGIHAESVKDKAIYGASPNWVGIWGHSDTSTGIRGDSSGGWGVQGESVNNDGVIGFSHNGSRSGVAGINLTNGIGVYGRSDGGGLAGWFDGRCRVNVLEIVGGSDLAENFDVNESVEPGTVMTIDPDNVGRLRVSSAAYDSTVAGVISGANNLGAGIVLPNPGTSADAQPLAMSGRVWVNCDASSGPIKPGDLLTTSETPGHAMKVADRVRSQGATIGKAMSSLAQGRGLVLALVSLQ